MKILLFAALMVLCLFAASYLTSRRPPTAAGSKPSPPNAMEVAHACAVLGLSEADIDKDTVVAAHKRLMQHVHPDKGGSTLLAQQLNDAKHVLLTRL